MGGLQEIERLIGGAAMPVALARAGEPRHVPSIVGRGAYRVVRTALDSARAATAASVAIEYMPGAVAVEISHDGGGGDFEAVAELAARLGGGLTAAPRAGRFRVRAWLPTEGQPPCPAAPLAAR